MQWPALPDYATVKQKLLILAIKSLGGSLCLCPRSLLRRESCPGHTGLLGAPSPTCCFRSIAAASAHTFCPGRNTFLPCNLSHKLLDTLQNAPSTAKPFQVLTARSQAPMDHDAVRTGCVKYLRICRLVAHFKFLKRVTDIFSLLCSAASGNGVPYSLVE